MEGNERVMKPIGLTVNLKGARMCPETTEGAMLGHGLRLYKSVV